MRFVLDSFSLLWQKTARRELGAVAQRKEHLPTKLRMPVQVGSAPPSDLDFTKQAFGCKHFFYRSAHLYYLYRLENRTERDAA